MEPATETAQPSSTEQAKALLRLREDPIAFGLQVLGRKAYTPDQQEIFRAIVEHDRVAVHSGHNLGKTVCAADLAVWWLLTRRPSKVLTTAPTFPQVQDLIWSEIRTTYRRVPTWFQGLPPPLQGEPRWTLAADHFAVGRSTDRPYSLQGLHSPNILVLVDEAVGLEPMIWEQIHGITSSRGAKILAISQPSSPSGIFYDMCRGYPKPVWKTLHLDCYNHPNILSGRDIFPGMIDQEWIQGRKDEWGEQSPMYIARVRGQFPVEGSDTLIPLSWVEASMERWSKGEVDETASKIMACDVARFGDNETVVLALAGKRVTRILFHVGKDTIQTIGRINALRAELGYSAETQVAVDDDGLGGGVVDALVDMGVQVLPFRGGQPAEDKKQFFNLRSESWWAVRKALQDGYLDLIPDDRLKSQLTSIKYDYTKDGRIKLETKEEMEKRGIPSPDRADALVMAWWAQAPSYLNEQLAKKWAGTPASRRASRVTRDWRDSFSEVSGMPGGGGGGGF